jgi:hypothetical protein
VKRQQIIQTPDSPEDLLSTSPFDDDDLVARLAAAPPRRRAPVATVLLGAGVLLVAGFAAGVRADRGWGASQRPASASVLGQLAARGGGQGFQGLGQRGGDANATTGTVRLVDGDTIYVQTSSGIVRVRTSRSTKVTVAKKAAAKDLRTGSRVVVHGTPGQDGTVTATSVDPGQ